MEKCRDTILKYFKEGEITRKDYNYYLLKNGWQYKIKKTGPYSVFGEGITQHILRIKDSTLILLGTYRSEIVAKWIKSEKEIPRRELDTEFSEPYWCCCPSSKPYVYYFGGRVIRVAFRTAKK